VAKLEAVLIIDDDVSLTKILRAELTSVGYEVEVMNDSSEVLNRLQNEFYDLILLDLKMPQVDGFKILKELRSKNYPGKIIVMTAYADVENAVQAKKLGADDFLPKPYDLDELLITIQKVLHS
jgi:DNA-binding response OmpR family regulator